MALCEQVLQRLFGPGDWRLRWRPHRAGRQNFVYRGLLLGRSAKAGVFTTIPSVLLEWFGRRNRAFWLLLVRGRSRTVEKASKTLLWLSTGLL